MPNFGISIILNMILEGIVEMVDFLAGIGTFISSIIALDWLHTSQNVDKNIAGFIWSALASPRAVER